MKAHEPRSAYGIVGRRCAMGRRCVLTAGKAERAELEQLSRSAVRGGADRARAVLWSLAGETSAAIAARLRVPGAAGRGGGSGGRAGGGAGRGARGGGAGGGGRAGLPAGPRGGGGASTPRPGPAPDATQARGGARGG